MSPEHCVVLSVLHYKTQILLLSSSEMSQQLQEDILARLGLNMTVTKGVPPGPVDIPLTTEGPAADPGSVPPAASGGASGLQGGGPEENGGRGRKTLSLGLLKTRMFQDISILGLELCIPGKMYLLRSFGHLS